MRCAFPAAAQQVRKTGEAWLRIYGGPEAAGLLAAAAAFGLVHLNGGPLLGAALAGAWAEDVAFVGYFAVRAIREQSRQHKHRRGVTYYLLTFWSAFCSLFIELGPAETVDKFARPALLYQIPHRLHNLAAGFIVAKLAADIIYYLLAFAGRTVRMRYAKPVPGPPAPPPLSTLQATATPQAERDFSKRASDAPYGVGLEARASSEPSTGSLGR